MSRIRITPPPEQGTGTVTSVGLVMPAGFSVANSPVTGSGTLTVTLSTLDASKIAGGTFATDAAIFTTDNAAKVPVKFRGVLSQSASLTEWQNNTPTTVLAVNALGHIGNPTAPSSATFRTSEVWTGITANIQGFIASNSETLTANNAFAFSGLAGNISLNHGTFNKTGKFMAIQADMTVAGTSGTVTNTFLFDGRTVITTGGTVTDAYGFRIRAFTNSGGGSVGTVTAIELENQTVGSTDNIAFRAQGGKFIHNEGGFSTADFRVETDTDTHAIFAQASTNFIAHGTSTPATKLHVVQTDAVTNTVVDVLTLGHNGGSVAANFGTGISIQGESSTTNNVDMGRIRYFYVSPTHASYTVESVWSARDSNGERDAIRIRANGSAVEIGLYGVTPAVRPPAYTFTNGTLDRTIDCNATTVEELADIVFSMWTDITSWGGLQ